MPWNPGRVGLRYSVIPTASSGASVGFVAVGFGVEVVGGMVEAGSVSRRGRLASREGEGGADIVEGRSDGGRMGGVRRGRGRKKVWRKVWRSRLGRGCRTELADYFFGVGLHQGTRVRHRVWFGRVRALG